MNRVVLTGRLTKDPDVKYLNAGVAIAGFSLAVDRITAKKDVVKDGGEREKSVDFFTCTAFGKTAEIVGNYCQKGSGILIEGSLQNNHYTDKNGVAHYGEKIIVNRIEFIGGRKTRNADMPAGAPDSTSGFESMGNTMPGLPFDVEVPF